MPTLVARRWIPPQGPGVLLPLADRRPFSYRAFVPDEISGLGFALGSGTAAAIGDAEAAVRALDGRSRHVPALEALSRLLLRAEGMSSSRIEGLQTGHRQLAEAIFDPEHSRGIARAVVANVDAISEAIESGHAGPVFTVAEVKEVHRTLMRGSRDAGELRTVQNWIGGAHSMSPRTADFVPPPETDVARLLDDLSGFINRSDISPLTQAAIAHAQFETIHPFEDGNGRTGRALIHAVLRRRSLIHRYVPPVSIVLAANPRTYIAGLTTFRAGHLDEWLEVFAAATVEACSGATRFFDALGALQADWLADAEYPRRGSTARRLIDAIPGFPILDVRLVERELNVSFQAANEAIERLESGGVLRRHEAGVRRGRRWSAPRLFGLLDGFQWIMSGPTQRLDGSGPRRPAPSPTRQSVHRLSDALDWTRDPRRG